MSERKNQRVSDSKLLVDNAAKGDIKAQFQLAKLYAQGKFVSEDLSQSAQYYSQVLASSQTFDPRVTSIDLFSFRRFKQLKIKLHPKTTILVGNNGSGKTTIIEALAQSLSWLAALIKNEDGNGQALHERDVNNSPSCRFTAVVLNLSIQKKLNYQQKLVKYKPGQVSKERSELGDIKQLAEIYRYCNEHIRDFGLPLMAYYSIERSVEVKGSDFTYVRQKGDQKQWQKLDAYTDALNESKSFKLLLSWFSRIDSVDKNSSKDQEAIAVLKAKIASRCDVIEQLPLDNEATKALRDELLIKNAESQKTLAALKLSGQQSESLYPKLSERVKAAIVQFMPTIANIRINHAMDSVDMLMEKDGVTISAQQLSQGEKSLFALVGDIARRLVMLNPASDQDPLAGKGIVIIDEIDLHLHPRWQQQVVQQLNDTFPNIQFILTTHSPQVLSTVSPECIRIINDTEKGIELITPDFSLGSESKQILEELLGVPSRPENIEVVRELMEYQALIAKDQWDTPRAQALREKLVIWAGHTDPIILKLDMDIRLRKRRRIKK